MLFAEIALDYLKLPASSVFFRCAEVFEQHGYTRSSFAVGARPEDLESAKHFGFKGSTFAIDFGPVANASLDLITLRTTVQLVDLISLMDSLVEGLGPKQAFVHSADYYKWQNAEDVLVYKAAGRPYQHLPMVDNGLPPPLTQQVVDVSRNPGRRYLRRGLIEAVSSPMWVRQEMLLPSRGVLDELVESVCEIGAHLRVTGPEAPCSESSSSYQESLRRLLYAA